MKRRKSCHTAGIDVLYVGKVIIMSRHVMQHLSDSRVFLRHQFVHVAVKDDVDVALQPDPDVVEFVC